MRYFILSLNIFLVTACAFQKPVKSELPLFITGNSSKLYLINVLPASSSNSDMHWCLMASVSSSHETQTINYYHSTWGKKDSVFKWQTHFVQDMKRDETSTFPIVNVSRTLDTLADMWQWEMDRKHLKLVIQTAKNERSSYKLNYPNHDSLPLHFVNKQNSIYAIKPMPAELKMTGENKLRLPVIVNLSIFDSFNTFLEKYKGQTLLWLDAWIPSQGNISTLQVISSTGEVNGVFFYANQKHIQAQVSVLPNQNWKSSLTNKVYPLVFEMELQQPNTSLIISPRLLNQELNQKQASFWMGAVVVCDKFSNLEIGSGNMYLFPIK